MSINFVEDKSIHKHNFLFENNYCISLRLHGFCLQIYVVVRIVWSSGWVQNYTHPDDHTIRTTDTPGFKPFTLLNLCWLTQWIRKIKHINFTSRAHIVMVSSMAKWSFILVFCKCPSCLQPLSKNFKLFNFFFLIQREGPHGWDGRHWEGNRGNEWDIRRRRALKS